MLEGGSTALDADHPRQPNDEESLVPKSAFKNGLGNKEQLVGFCALALAMLAAGSQLRPRNSGIFLGACRVLMEVAGYFGIAVICPPLLLSVPLIVIWIIAKRLTVEPCKSSWYRVTSICTRSIMGAFLYLLAIEGITLHRPLALPLEAVPPLLLWQSTILSYMCKWLGAGAYAAAVMWLLTDKIAKYFLDRALTRLSLREKPAPARPHHHGLVNLTQFFFFPITMVCNCYLYNTEGILPAATTIASITVGIFAVVLVDALLYWTYFFWTGRRQPQVSNGARMSPTDCMALALFGFAVRDPKTGKTTWDLVREKGPEETVALRLEFTTDNDTVNHSGPEDH
ncbi:hypothetical protein B0H11DRAFT_1972003 [Mycena galericulata]|nr:hypothetical protein B0H11DRAFT_1972003 [Mycena galericulata]